MSDEQIPASKLDLLPPHIKTVLHQLIKQGYGGIRIKDYMEKRFGLEMIIVSRTTYDTYISNHREELLKEKQAEDKNKEILNQIDQFDTWGTDVAGDDSKLGQMIDFHLGRARQIVDEQALSTDPRLEANLIAHLSAVQKLRETAEKQKVETDTQNEANRLKDLERWTTKLIERVVDLHKKIHGEDKHKEFFEEFAPMLQTILEEMAREHAREKKQSRPKA